MPAPSLSNPAATLAPTAARTGRRVIDAPIRMFHWLFALCFIGAYLTADGERWRMLHVTLGYSMVGLLAFRVVYGLIGPRQARLSLMWHRLAATTSGLRQAAAGRSPAGAPWRQGQSLFTALAVALPLALTVPLVLSGYAAFNEWGTVFGDEWLEELHEFFGNAMLAVVAGHVGLIGVLSVLRRKNQARPMVTGRIEGSGPDLVKHNRRGLAALLLVAVLAYGTLEWRQAPGGLLAASASHGGHERKHDHDD